MGTNQPVMSLNGITMKELYNESEPDLRGIVLRNGFDDTDSLKR